MELNGISSSFSWIDYWTVEIGPVRDEMKLDRLWRGTATPPNAGTHFVGCEPEEAELWSVYGRTREGDAMLIHDASTHEEALRVAAECMAAIAEHGLPFEPNS